MFCSETLLLATTSADNNKMKCILIKNDLLKITALKKKTTFLPCHSREIIFPYPWSVTLIDL